MSKNVKHGALCPNSDITAISSPKCQKCDNYISHELVGDEHGRIDYVTIDCKLINEQENTQIPDKKFLISESDIKSMCKAAFEMYMNDIYDDKELEEIFKKWLERTIDTVKSKNNSFVDLIIDQLDKWIESSELQAELFREKKMLVPEISSQAMAQAYWNIKTFIDVNKE